MAFYTDIEPENIRDAITYATTTTEGNLKYIMHQSYIPGANDNFKVIYDYLDNNGKLAVSNKSALMHNKFAVVINRTSETGRVWTGSYNPNRTLPHPHSENVIWIESFKVAEAYASEFLTMWNEGNGSFSTDKATHTYTYRKVDVGGTKVEVYFTPYNYYSSGKEPVQAVVSLIDKAERSILFNKYNFRLLLSEVVDALIDAHKEGIRVKGIIEEERRLYEKLKGYGIDIYFSGIPFGYLHHKFSIIDSGTSKAKTVTGSPNWTVQGYGVGSTRHDENFLIIHCPNIADRYYKEFMKNYSLAVSGEEAARGKAAVSNTFAWPSPVRAHEDDEGVNITYELSSAVNKVYLHIYTISGRRVKSIESDDVRPGAVNEIEWKFSSSYPGPGLYIAAVEVETGDGTFYDTTKFAVIR